MLLRKWVRNYHAMKDVIPMIINNTLKTKLNAFAINTFDDYNKYLLPNETPHTKVSCYMLDFPSFFDASVAISNTR